MTGPLVRPEPRALPSDFGTLAMLAGLELGLFSSLAALSPWPIGIWLDSEPIALAVHAGAALAALGLAARGWTDAPMLRSCLGHRFVLVTVAAALWGGVAAISAPDGAAALLGTAETAEGPLLFADTAIFIASGLALMRTGPTRAILAWSAIAGGLIFPILSLFPATEIYFFGAWLTYPAIAAPIATALLLEDRFGTSSRLGLAALAGLPGWLLSGSFTAIAAGLLVAPAVWWACRAPLAPEGRRHSIRVLSGLAVAIPIGLALFTMAFAWSFGTVKPDLRALESLWSRGHLQMALLADLVDRPWLLLVGEGWGQVGTIFSRTVPAAGLPLWDGSWDLMGRSIVSSHHFALEALLGGGLSGLVLRLGSLALLPLACRPGRWPVAGFFALALGTLGSLWFQLPGTVAMVALAIAALADAPPTVPARPPLLPSGRLLVGLLVLFALVGAATVLLLGRAAIEARAIQADYINPSSPPPAGDCRSQRVSGVRGEPYLAFLLSNALTQFRQDVPSGSVSEPSLLALANLVCLAQAAPYRDSEQIETFVLALRGDLMVEPAATPYRRFFPALTEAWDDAVFRYLARAPRRTDLAIPYLVWLERRGQVAEMLAATDRLLTIDSEDPVALWYSGASLTRERDPAQVREGFRRLNRALTSGIALRIPVDAALRTRILNRSGSR